MKVLNTLFKCYSKYKSRSDSTSNINFTIGIYLPLIKIIKNHNSSLGHKYLLTYQ